MHTLGDIARLNVALEFVSECAGLTGTEAALHLIAHKLRWIVDFDECALVLRDGKALRWWSMRSGDQGLSAAQEDSTDPVQALLGKALATGMPAQPGVPLQVIALPLGPTDASLGALCVRGRAGLSYGDFRFLQHVASALGSALLRISQSEQLMAAMARSAALDREARDKANAANEAKDAFVAMLAHELRNPLAPILIAVELLRRDVAGPSHHYLDILDRQARQLNRLVDDLLDTSRLTTGKITLQRSSVDLRIIVSSAVEAAKPRMTIERQELIIVLPEAAATVDGDAARLTQAMTNLLLNASKFSPPGSRITLRVALSSDRAYVEVEDQGIGIEASMLDTIFDMFVQGRRSEQRSPDGLGLGLGVARALVQLHGGTITAASAGPNLGSTFRVTLPRVTVGSEDLSNDLLGEELPVREPTAARRILLVDDNVDAAVATGAFLVDAGHHVTIAHDPAEALAKAGTVRPEVAILDLGLPMMDGYALARALRQQLGTSAPRFVALSGYGHEADRQRSAECGFAAHLVKPARLNELLASIEDALTHLG